MFLLFLDQDDMHYKRNQIEEALWRLFNEGNTGEPIPVVFRTRIKRLLELDRSMDLPDADGLAFQDARPEGRGVEVAFTSANVFALALGLDLLDMGYKQAEIVFLLQHIRDSLTDIHEYIMKGPPAAQGRLLPNNRPNSPTMTIKGREYADCNVFLLIRKVELKEAWSAQPKDPLILKPGIAYGRAELNEKMSEMGMGNRKFLVLEIANSAALLEAWLGETEPIKRGPG